jgi:hypothetical protein
MVTAMLMVYLNLSKSASLPLGLLGRLDQRVNPLHGPCVNLGNYWSCRTGFRSTSQYASAAMSF